MAASYLISALLSVWNTESRLWKRTRRRSQPAGCYVLNSDGRRTFLFRLTISEAKEARVLRLLAKAGDFADLGNETLPLPEQILSTTDFMYEAAPESVPL